MSKILFSHLFLHGAGNKAWALAKVRRLPATRHLKSNPHSHCWIKDWTDLIENTPKLTIVNYFWHSNWYTTHYIMLIAHTEGFMVHVYHVKCNCNTLSMICQ